MTDHVTNVEIEDVLSSIRRLVSDDARVLKPAQVPVNQPDKLVLTPSLRVSSDEPVAAVVVQEKPDLKPVSPPDQAESNESNVAPMLLTDLAPAVEDAVPEPDFVQELSAEAESSGGPVAFAHPSDGAEAPDSTDETGAGEIEAGETLVSDPVDDPIVVPEFISRADPEDSADIDEVGMNEAGEAALLMQIVEREVEQVLAEKLAEQTDESLGEKPEAGLDSGPDSGVDAGLAGDQDAEDLSELEETVTNLLGADAEPDTAEMTPELAAETQVNETASEQPSESLEDKIAALEELVGRDHAENWEPETPEPEAPVFKRSSDVLEWQDHLPQEEDLADQAAPEAEQPVPDVSTEKDAEQGDAAVALDENMLRGMVSEIVRQELQGALGERITRNVRKLVRREIHRVLMSQDFE